MLATGCGISLMEGAMLAFAYMCGVHLCGSRAFKIDCTLKEAFEMVGCSLGTPLVPLVQHFFLILLEQPQVPKAKGNASCLLSCKLWKSCMPSVEVQPSTCIWLRIASLGYLFSLIYWYLRKSELYSVSVGHLRVWPALFDVFAWIIVDVSTLKNQAVQAVQGFPELKFVKISWNTSMVVHTIAHLLKMNWNRPVMMTMLIFKGRWFQK